MTDNKTPSMELLQDQIEEVAGNLQQCREKVNEELNSGTVRMDKLQLQVQCVDKKIDQVLGIISNVDEIVTAWNNTQGFVRTVQTISKVLRWTTLTGVAVAALWYLITHGKWPG